MVCVMCDLVNKFIFIIFFGVDMEIFMFFDKWCDVNGGDGVVCIGIIKVFYFKYGIGEFICVFSWVYDEWFNIVFCIWGGGLDENFFKVLVCCFVLDGLVEFCGVIDYFEVRDVLGSLDIFVVLLILDLEFFGVVIIEVGVCGLLVVVSDVDGLVEVVEDGVIGLIVFCGDVIVSVIVLM